MARRASSDHRLLVLGLLRGREMHGYQIAETIGARFGGRLRIKTPTLYDTLKRLRAEGLVRSREEQEGSRPSRAVYALTPEGDGEFMDLLRESVGTYLEPDLPGDVGLVFIEALEPSDARALLLARGEELLVTVDEMLTADVGGAGSRILSSRRSHHLLAESAWMEEVLESFVGEADDVTEGEADG